MIVLLIGDNTFELARSLEDYERVFKGTLEKFDGADLELSQLPDLFLGANLFAEKRCIVIRNLSENKPLWDVLPNWLERVSNDTEVIFVEQNPDKRTRTYKELMKFAEIKEYAAWGDRDVLTAEKWAIKEAKKMGFLLDKKYAQALIRRTGPNQWGVYHALQKLSLVEELTIDVINDLIEATPNENVFNVFDAALKGDRLRVIQMLHTLRQTQDPYMTFGLLSSQCFQLAAIAATEKPINDIARDLGGHPFALAKLAPHTKRLGREGIRKMTKYFAKTDIEMKSSSVDPWLLIEELLIKTSSL